jgi:Rab-GTPase-TBC domain
MTCQQEHDYRMYKCEKLFALRDVVDGRTQECLRRLAVFPGLPVKERANVWKLFLKLRTPMKETWTFSDKQRREAYDSLLEASCVKEYDEHDDVIKVFMFYAAMDGNRSATAHGPTYSPSSVCYPGSALSSADLESIRAMCAVLKQALVYDYQVFWGLVMLTNQLNRIAVSQSGTVLQRYSVSHRVMAFSKRLAVVDPDLSHLLEQKLGILPSVYADKWFRSLFALAFGEKRIDAVVRLWDALIASPFELVVHVAVHFVLKMKEPIQAILACNHEPAEVLTTQVVKVLETLPNIDKSTLDEILYTIWQGTDTLFRGSTELRDLDHRISFLVEWPVVKRGTVNSSIVRILQFLLRARGLGSIFFVGMS